MQRQRQRFRTIGLIGIIGGLALAAGPAATAQTTKKADTITVHGCLTKGPSNSFVLTPTTAGDPLSSSVSEKTHGVVPTYTYQLTGGQNLDAYVGKVVAATGTIDRSAKASAKVDQSTGEQPAGSASPTSHGKTPTVKTEEKAKIEVRQLTVQSVTPTDQACPSGKGT
jgi:hypothetical protein